MFDLIGAQCIGEGGGSSGGGGFASMLGPALQAAGELAKGGIAMKEKSDADAKSQADKNKKLADARQALQDAATGIAKADVSAQLKSGSASTDAAAADVLKSSASRAISGADQEELGKWADTQLSAAVKNAQGSPNDGYKAALMRAWTTLANMVHAGAIVQSDKGSKGGEIVKSGGGGGSWFSQKTGPVPNWAVAGGGALGVGLLVKKFLLH